MNGQEYNQPTAAPTQKMTAVGVAGLVVTVLLGLANVFGIVIPEEVSGAAVTLVAAAVTIVTFVAGYVKKEKKA